MNLKKTYDKLSVLPGGKFLFMKAVGVMAPYSGTIHPQLEELRFGYCRLTLDESHGIRNHLGCIHAIALMNLGELITGLPLLYSLPENSRAIIVKLEMEYYKKARGRLSGECRFRLEEKELCGENLPLEGFIRDAAGEVVAKSVATWRVDEKSS